MQKRIITLLCAVGLAISIQLAVADLGYEVSDLLFALGHLRSLPLHVRSGSSRTFAALRMTRSDLYARRQGLPAPVHTFILPALNVPVPIRGGAY